MKGLDTYAVRGVEFVLRDPDASTVRETVPGHPYEPAATAVLTSLLRRGNPTFVDVGALYGYFAVYAARLNPACRVHAFEPNPSARTWP
jgi:precorrin-6B methylase 2